MLLQEQLAADLKAAMKAKDALTRDVLRLLKTDLGREELNKGSDLTEPEVIAVLQRAVKTRNESVEEYVRAGREDAAQLERDEISVVNRYLPTQWDEAETRLQMSTLATELGVSGKQDMGKLMKELKARHGAKVDMRLASRLAGELLAG